MGLHMTPWATTEKKILKDPWPHSHADEHVEFRADSPKIAQLDRHSVFHKMPFLTHRCIVSGFRSIILVGFPTPHMHRRTAQRRLKKGRFPSRDSEAHHMGAPLFSEKHPESSWVQAEPATARVWSAVQRRRWSFGGWAPTKLVGDLQRAFQPHRLVGLSF